MSRDCEGTARASELRRLREEKMAIEAALMAYLMSDVDAPGWADRQTMDLLDLKAKIRELEAPSHG
jgi:hypothetical protein